MAKHAKTIRLIETAIEILSEHNPMTVRQVYYQLVSRQVIKNNRCQYQAVSKALVYARQQGYIPWNWLEDRLRKPREVQMWSNLAGFAETCRKSYRRDVWPTQPRYLEVWLEKDALSGIFEEALQKYGVTLNVGRGYDGWDSIHNAATRFANRDGVAILYFGDFDPSGEDMVKSLRKRLGSLGSNPNIVKCALTIEDIDRYSLPSDFTKRTDTRSAAFVEKFGDLAVELDALPVEVLRDRLVAEVESHMDLDKLVVVQEKEQTERARLIRLLDDGHKEAY